jgi:hypothetical protein
MRTPKSLKAIWPSVFDKPTQYVDHTKIWRLNGDINGVLHRDGGRPAIVRENGSQEWWVNGQLHRENGPAVELADGGKQYYLNGIQQEKPPEPQKSWWKKKLRL